MQTMTNPKLIIIGCGPHTKRVYIPKLKELESKFKIEIISIVELESKKNETEIFIKKFFPETECRFFNKSNFINSENLPKNVETYLNKLINFKKINSIIIATDPLNRMPYINWALDNELHIFIDKPISTYNNIANDKNQFQLLSKDYNKIISKYKSDKAFIINAQRRFLPQFEIIKNKIIEISTKFKMPITSIQSSHSDGQWRLPNEILKLDYHPLLGWGKVSHSGYHFIDFAAQLIKLSYQNSDKNFDKISVYSKFLKPSGLLYLQSQKDLERIFGTDYRALDSRTDQELLNLYATNNEAEVDATSVITFYNKNRPTTIFSLNLLHNSFSRRSWLHPNMKNLYKGNGRVRHEYHNIVQGPLQTIQVHSYQSKSEHDLNKKEDTLLGGNNHYEIFIFRNTDIIGGPVLEVINSNDIIEKYHLDQSKILNEIARHEALTEFLEIIVGIRLPQNNKSTIYEHKLSVKIMSLIYESAVKKKEISKDLILKEYDKEQ